MKARVKATGEIIEVAYLSEDKYGNKYYNVTTDTRTYRETELEMTSDKGDYFYTYDYWERLKHQYAGMAMQGILGNQTYTKHLLETSTSAKDARDIIVDASYYLAHALVEKIKEGNNG